MPKKDTEAAVLGMLSSVGAQTRRAADTAADPASAAGERPVAAEGEQPAVSESLAMPGDEPEASVSRLPSRAPKSPVDNSKRTVRLRSTTAVELRNAWLEAKRDDVLLTVQDFASDLVDDALARRRRRRTTATSS